MAEVASAYPTAGGPYWWANELGGPVWSWFTGWFNLIGSGRDRRHGRLVLRSVRDDLFNLWGLDFIVNFADAVSLEEIFIVFVVILGLHALINIYSSHLVALFNNISVFWHCVGVRDHHRHPDHRPRQAIRASTSCSRSGSTTPASRRSGMYWYYILPTGLLLTMYTVTGYDASAHVAEETKDAEESAAKGVWQSVALSALIGWFVLLAITFAASDVDAVNEAGGTSLAIFTSAMDEGWAETVILISTVGQFFCGMACVTSCSRTFFAFSRDRADTWQQAVERRQREAQGAGGRGARLLRPCADPDPPGAVRQRRRSPGRLLRGRLDRGARALHRLRDPGLPALAQGRQLQARVVDPGGEVQAG